jgi:Ceramidase
VDWAGAADVAWVDAYCERTGPGLVAEPLNAVTNLAFLVAALALWRLARGGRSQPAAHASLSTLAVLLAVIGLSSLAFHTLATGWAGTLDSLSIAVFVHYYVVCFTRWFAGISWRWAWLAAPGFAVFTVIVVASTGGGDTASYLPALIGLVGLAAGLGVAGLGADARRFAVAGGVFAGSLLLRSIDGSVCGSFPAGTHFLWHLLNALVLYLIGWALVLRWRALPTQASHART